MLWRRLSLVRPWSAASLLSFSLLGAVALAEPPEPQPDASRMTQTIDLLEAARTGVAKVEVRGQGEDRVRIQIQNTTPRRLNVVIPPGLVAAASGPGQLGGFQNMGLGTLTDRPGSFGQFQASPSSTGFHSVAATEPQPVEGIAVPPELAVTLSVPAVCLDFGKPTPTSRHVFELMDVDEFTTDVRVRKALRSLGTLGTSQGVAQATVWRVCNNLPFETMLRQAAKVINPYEAALAARLVEALDYSGTGELVNPADLTRNRLLVQVQSPGPLAEQARRLNEELQGQHLLGLPARVVAEGEEPSPVTPALALQIELGAGPLGQTQGVVTVRYVTFDGQWKVLGQAPVSHDAAVAALDGETLALAVDRAVASTFVASRPLRRSAKSTQLQIENRLPFTLSHVVVKTGSSAGDAAVPLSGVGVGPGRTSQAPLPAANGFVERVVLNGL